jgi:Common central domain of tyrosinase
MCQHRDPLFLPWHRPYLCSLELALQAEIPGRDPAVILP